ncbi:MULTISPECIES: hypothetical protein [Metabacillus]|jgi:hypothetical protein|uniref:Uncharacterized protein n=1 Tax=Metabacillus rhizolycopersici TaxID=2875709 RepID=A0ABS7UVR5_9BACI|nr:MULTISPECIES: hypothetical protein [Metabacillus]MBZ5752035.1 hypothetical protein [Metabacillus rhizolycopersici]MCM3650809.1 hypothetical protein [Metabacillus litoralis]
MWIISGILLIGAIISLFEIPPLVKKKWWREIIVYFILLSVGMTLAILISKDVAIPTPIDLLTKIYSPVTNFMEKFLS